LNDSKRKNIIFLPDIYEVANVADVVCICVHLDDSTRKMIDKRFFETMKQGSVFINTSRGDVINEEDLLNALRNNHISAAGIDVLSNEDKLPDYNHPLIEFAKNDSRLTITPHIAGLTIDSEVKAQTYAYNKVLENLEIN
jgi:phosphoglycerate dehydrogenase-like enzyme